MTAYRLILIYGILHTPTALRNPGWVKHWHRWHSQDRRRQSEVYTWRRDLNKNMKDILIQQTISNGRTANHKYPDYPRLHLQIFPNCVSHCTVTPWHTFLFHSPMFFLTCSPTILSPFYTGVLHITSPISVIYISTFFPLNRFSGDFMALIITHPAHQASCIWQHCASCVLSTLKICCAPSSILGQTWYLNLQSVWNLRMAFSLCTVSGWWNSDISMSETASGTFTAHSRNMAAAGTENISSSVSLNNVFIWQRKTAAVQTPTKRNLILTPEMRSAVCQA